VNRRVKTATRWLSLIAVLAMIVAACGGGGETTDTTEDGGATTTAADDMTETTSGDDTTDTTEAMSDEPVIVCELAYYTGEFAPYGPSLSADVVFPVEEIINDDPPLGREWEVVAEDLGTVGEAQAARACIEQQQADIMVSPAHGYRTYRDYALEVVAEEDRPLMPTVHGGTIPKNLGGEASEPIFRAQGLDEGLGTFGALYAQQVGAEQIVIFATEVEGFQLAADAAEAAAEELGIEVLARYDVEAERPSYATEAQAIADLQPDLVIVQAGSVESATLIKQAAEAGLSLTWIGETGWIQPEFIGTLGADVVATQEQIGYAAFGHQENDAWDFFSEEWNNNPSYGGEFGPASDQYHFSTYDLMVHTALAVEYAGSYNASAWAPAMFEVGDPPGTACYTYSECLELIRAGEDIDYEGVTGPGTYSEGGVNAITPSVTLFNDDGSVGEEILIDAEQALAITEAIAVQADCNEENECDW
jgi:branched-chain amino acid transport system substrate-binding protein